MQQCRSVYSEVLIDCGLQILHALHARVGDLPVVVVHRLADILHDSVLNVLVEGQVVAERCQTGPEQAYQGCGLELILLNL